jgi:exopolysaccharide biosynthesis predicted pyruvyltransferase EpsI
MYQTNCYPLLLAGIVKKECTINPKVHDPRTYNSKFRIQLVFEYLRRYAEAKVLITTRLHAGVPAAGMGVPVILVSSGL